MIPDFARPKTSYRELGVFQKAQAIYDLTYFFLQKHIPKTDRTYNQMLQAARSGKQNTRRPAQRRRILQPDADPDKSGHRNAQQDD